FFSLCCRGFAPQNISGYESPSLYKDLPEHFNFASDVLDKWSQMEKNGERDSSIPALWWVGDQGNEVRWSFEELGFLSRKAANVLSDACGLKKGDRVIVMLPRIPEWWSITVGCIRTGIIYIPATTQLTANDIFYRLQASKAKCIITNDTLAPVVDSVVSKCQFLKIRLMVSEGSRDGWLDFKELLKAAHGDHNPVKTKSQEAMTIYFTSGTTGYPKMVEHSHSSFGIGMTSTGSYFLNRRIRNICSPIKKLKQNQVVKAFVILSPDVASHDPEKLTKELQEHVKKVTAPYKYPRKVEFVQQLPKTISGKIQRKELRKKEWERI
ncbi:hypothetical protein KIL84_014636, partial [Mauremys mutica]